MVRKKAPAADQDTVSVEVVEILAPGLTGELAGEVSDIQAAPIGTDETIAPPPRKTASTSARTPLVLGAVLGIVAAGLGYGAALKFPILPQTAQAVDTSALEMRIAALESAQSAPADDSLNARLAALETAPKADTAALETKLKSLEDRLATIPDFDNLRAELAAIRQKLAQTDPAPAIKSAIAAEMTAVQQTAQQMLDSVQQTAQQAAQDSAISLLRAALDTGGAFESAAQDLTLPAELSGFAKTGVPSLSALKDSFPDAARAGLDAALRSDLGASWTERVTNFLRSQTGARALTPQTGDDPDAVLSRADAALRAADLATAMAEISALPEAAQTAMADWIAAADARAKALAAFDTFVQSRGQ